MDLNQLTALSGKVCACIGVLQSPLITALERVRAHLIAAACGIFYIKFFTALYMDKILVRFQLSHLEFVRRRGICHYLLHVTLKIQDTAVSFVFLNIFLLSIDPCKPSAPNQSTNDIVLPLSPADSLKAEQAEVRRGIGQVFYVEPTVQ